MTAPVLELARAEVWRDEALALARQWEASPRWCVARDAGGLVIELLSPAPEAPAVIRGEVRLGGALADIAQVALFDREAHKLWDSSLTRWQVLARAGTDHELVHLDVCTGAHPLVRNRELVFHEATLRGPGSCATVAVSRPYPDVAGFPGCVRAHLGMAWRRLDELGAGQVRYRALWQVDLRGALPRRLVTRGQITTMWREHRWFSARWPATH